MLRKCRRATGQKGEVAPRGAIDAQIAHHDASQRDVGVTNCTEGVIAMNIESLLREADPALTVSIPDPDLRAARIISSSDTDATLSATFRRTTFAPHPR